MASAAQSLTVSGKSRHLSAMPFMNDRSALEADFEL